MKKLIPLLIAFVAGVAITMAVWHFWSRDFQPVPHGEPTAAPTGDGWIDLLAEQDAWENITDEKDIFEFDGDMLHIFGHTIVPLRYVGYTARDFEDFELHLEYKVAAGANSGVFLRIDPENPLSRGWEVQVLDDFGLPPSKNRSGGIYDVTTPMYNMSRPAGSWNSYDITVRGQDVTVVMNGWKVVETDLSKMTMPIGKFETPFAELPLKGMIAFQDHGGEVWYRNVKVRPLDHEG
jgi:hypothetical protein